MKKRLMFFLMGALLIGSAAHAQDLAVKESAEGIDKKVLAQRMSQDNVFREHTINNWNYLKVLDEWKGSLTEEQKEAYKNGDLMMPEFHTQEERTRHNEEQIKRKDEIALKFPEVMQLNDQERQWVRLRAANIVLKEYKKID